MRHLQKFSTKQITKRQIFIHKIDTYQILFLDLSNETKPKAMKKQISIFGFTIYAVNEIVYYNHNKQKWYTYSETILFNTVIDSDNIPHQWI